MADQGKFVSGVFITFSGNCRKALTWYQTCFGGTLQFETVELQGYAEMPVVSGSLFSESIIIHGSDLVYNEGRILGNYIAVFLHCKTAADRQALIQKLEGDEKGPGGCNGRELVEITDPFDVRWILSV